MNIGPRTDEYDNQYQHQWRRRINGAWFHFLHVKVTRTVPRIIVTREDPDTWSEVHRFTV